MNDQEIPERYVALCLRVGQHDEDFVDAYIGPQAFKGQAIEGEPYDPRKLRHEAVALMETTSTSALEDDRRDWLLGQLRGIECVTARLSGEDISWTEEVERCFGIRPQQVDEESLRTSHKKLDDALPGSGDLATRYNEWLDSGEVSREVLPRALDAIAGILRRRTDEIVELPAGEHVDFETVENETWSAFNWYRGDLSSLVQVNMDLPSSLSDLIDLVAHEAYPGHHTERAHKEKRLYRDGKRFEMCVMITAAPEAVIAEGVATNALEEALGGEGFGPVLAEIDDLGVKVDPDVAAVVHFESWKLFAAGTNVARMLHEDGLSTDEAESYLQEWALYSPERAAKTVSFLLDPATRAYATAYTDGQRVCRSFIDRTTDGFKRLLTEQLTVESIV